MYFTECLLLYSWAWIRQTLYIVIMTREWSTKIVNFMTPWGGVLVLRRGHRNHLSEYALSSTLSICSTLIAILLRDNDAAFLCHYLFFFCSTMGLLIYEPFWQEVRGESLILRWLFRLMGLLLDFYQIWLLPMVVQLNILEVVCNVADCLTVIYPVYSWF